MTVPMFIMGTAYAQSHTSNEIFDMQVYSASEVNLIPKAASEPVVQPNAEIQSTNFGIQQPKPEISIAVEKEITPTTMRKWVIMELPDNPTWMKSNNSERERYYLISDKPQQKERYVPIPIKRK